MHSKKSSDSTLLNQVKQLSEFLTEKMDEAAQDKKTFLAVEKLNQIVQKIREKHLEVRSVNAATALGQMSEDERRITLMFPDEKKFFLRYKKLHPDDPWSYAKAYQQQLQENYQKKKKDFL